MTTATTSKLTPFEGTDVIEATVRVTNAGDGLSEALGIDPVEYHQGDTVYVLLETTVSRVSYEAVKADSEFLKRVHTLKAGTGTIVDEHFARESIEMQREINQRARDAAAGQGRLDDDDPDNED